MTVARIARVAAVVCAIADVGLIVYGVLLAATPELLFAPIASVVGTDPAYLLGIARLVAFFNALVGAAGLVLLHAYRSRGDEHSLRTAYGMTVIGYLGPVVFDTAVGTIGAPEVAELVILVALLVLAAVWGTARGRAGGGIL